MGHVDGGEVVAVHHGLELVDGRVDEEGWVGAAGAAPYDVGRGVVVQDYRLVDDAGAFCGGGYVGDDGVESLGWRAGGGLAMLGLAVGARVLETDFDLLERVFQCLRGSGDDDDVGALGRKLAGGVEAEAA